MHISHVLLFIWSFEISFYVHFIGIFFIYLYVHIMLIKHISLNQYKIKLQDTGRPMQKW